MSEYKWDWDYLWHTLMGFGVNAILIWMFWGLPWWFGFATSPAVFAGGYTREKIQHKWQRLEYPHQWIEALTWGVGALLAAICSLPLTLIASIGEQLR
jgi:hypothetical protein